jgi:tetratricopeptide (TPR) repeat protein
LAQPMRRVNPRIPRDLQTIVTAAMDPEPDRRYASADDLANDLERLLNLQPIQARPAGFATRAFKLARRKRGTLFGAVVGGVLALVLAIAFGIYWFFMPGWAQARLDDARLALLDQSALDRVFMAASRSRVRPPSQAAFPEEVATVALAKYEAALWMAPRDDTVRLERDIVTLARDVSCRLTLGEVDAVQQGRSTDGRGLALPGGADDMIPSGIRKQAPLTYAYARRWLKTGHPACPSDLQLGRARAVDLRCLGLLAFLCQDVETSLAAWSRLDLLQDPDPLVEASLGQLHIAMDQPARAYPRLRSAFRAYPDAGFLCVSLADAALQCGDVQKAELLLKRARGMQRLDPTHGLARVEADLYAVTGRADLARQRYEWLRQAGGNFVALYNYGQFLEARGELWEAVRVYQEWVRDPRKVAKLDRAFVAAADSWWSSLRADERWELLRGTLDEDPAQPDAFIKLLRDYRASAGFLTRLRTSGAGEKREKSEASREIAALDVDDLSPFLQSTSLSTIVSRMELADMLQWARLRSYPSVLKDLQVYAWLTPHPEKASLLVGWLHRAWSASSLRGGREAGRPGWAAPKPRALARPTQITVPPGFVVDLLVDGFEGPAPRLEAIRNPDYGTGVVAALVDEGTVHVYRVSESSSELFASGPGFPREACRRNVRFDTTGHFGRQLYMTVGYAPHGDPEPAVWITTAILRVSEAGEIAQVGSYGTLDEPLVLEFDFTTGAGGYAPGAFLQDLFRSFDGIAGLYHWDSAGNLSLLTPNPVPPGRTHLHVWAAEFDPTGKYGWYLTMADSSGTIDHVAAVYQLRPDLTWVELTVPVSTDERFFCDLAFSPGGSFGETLYVADCVRGEIVRVHPNSEDELFALGFNFRTSEGWNIGSITVSDDGEDMYVSDAKGIYHIHALTADEKGQAPPAAD